MSGSNYTLSCPKCQAVNAVRGKAMTLAMTCSSCGVYFRVGNWDKNITMFDSPCEPALPLGTKGKIEGVVYEVMGFTVKKELKYKYHWREYLLFNPFQGYAFLSEYDGHWNIIWPIENEPTKRKTESDFYEGGLHYQLYQKYQANVIYARGEFFFDVVELTESTWNSEYIGPPFMFALEVSDDSLLWCKGEYIARQEVASAFNVPVKNLPAKKGIGYTQPVMAAIKPGAITGFTFFILLALIGMQFFFSGTAEEKIVYQGSFSQATLKDQKFFVTPSFQVDDGSKSLNIDIITPVQNDWFFGEFSLINDETGTEIIFTKDIEYYQGYEDGESWTEGSPYGEAFLSQIPGGKYHINIYPEFSTSSHEFTIVVKRDVATMSNFFITLFALALFPVGFFIRKTTMEKRRWEESDYSPYASYDDD